MTDRHPSLRSVVLDTTDAWRELLGYAYRSGDEPPGEGRPDPLGAEWLILEEPAGTRRLGFQQVPALPRPNWPEGDVPQQIHLDLSVADVDELGAQRTRALGLGATELLDRSDDAAEPLYVFADPSGHPFCIFVAHG